jgi:catechol 2,3-dioxygenase-like lactoylglutathione lyase family enzyme
MNIHHIGIAVKDIDEAAKTLALFGAYALTGKVYDGCQKATLQMFDCSGYSLELVEGRIVDSLLGGDSMKIYHICFEVENIIDDVEFVRKSGFMQITGMNPAPLFGDRIVTFMIKDGLIIELLEKQKKEVVRI